MSLWDTVKSAGSSIVNAGSDVINTTENITSTAINGAENLGSTVINDTKAVGNFTGNMLQFEAGMTRFGLEKTWNGIQKAGSATVNFTENLFDKATHPGNPNPPAAQGLKFSETKDASDVAYHGKQGEIYKFDDGKKWQVVDVKDDSGSGFRAVALKSTDPNDHRVIVAYAGTSGGLTSPDWQTDFKQAAGLSTKQYGQAVDFANKWKATDGNNVILTGHSLGGGLASYASIKTNLNATAVNAAPLALDHLGLNPLDARRITQYYVPGEALSVVNKVNPLDIRPGNGIEVQGRNSIFDPRSVGSNHSLDNVAPGIKMPELQK